jgi:hypothetical protein
VGKLLRVAYKQARTYIRMEDFIAMVVVIVRSVLSVDGREQARPRNTSIHTYLSFSLSSNSVSNYLFHSLHPLFLILPLNYPPHSPGIATST